uniref:YlbF family regulator n=1 Tax=Listeria monocytogenes TaxID=1639 RepID=UPI0034A5A51D
MLATMENMALLDLSDELASMILNSEEAQNYKRAKEALLNDANSQKNIRQFIRIKEQYEEEQRFGRYHPDYKEVTRKTRAYKREVDM